jgi:UDP-4-amino-4,6-dideoxy-N-acetyl-beta-L-altrosamine transaminase
VTIAAPFLPYGRHVVDEDDIAAVATVLRGDWLTTGPHVERFEASIARVTGAPFAISCSNATAGLHLAALAAGLGPGDTAIVPAITFLATANAVRYVGAEVIFADVDPDTALMRPSDLERALDEAKRLGRRVAAVFPVHMGGQCEDLAGMCRLARAAGAMVIEDAAHAIGTLWANTTIGDCAHSDMAVFSFHPVKTIASGEGGAITTRDPDLAKRLARARSHGMVRDPAMLQRPDLAFDDGAPNPWYYEMTDLGYNYRITDIQAALGDSQLRKLELFVGRRAALREMYERSLPARLGDVRMVPTRTSSRPAWHLATALVPFAERGVSRRLVMERMKARGIGTQVHYIPVPWQPFHARDDAGRTYPGAAAYYERALSLPLFASMEASDVDWVVDALAEALA